MRICLIGDFSAKHDEGMKNISLTLKNLLSTRHTILSLNSRDLIRKATVKKLSIFRPELVHYLHGPTIRSLAILKMLITTICPKSKIVVSATRPYFSMYSRWAVPLFKPDVIFSQSLTFEKFFQNKKCNVVFCPNGVNCQKFLPATISEKKQLQKEVHLPKNKKIILHVGHIKNNRNLEIFKRIQAVSSFQVVIVGGTSQKSDEALKDSLRKNGIIILHEYFDDISKIYNCSDLYVFPTKDTGSDMPTSYNQVGAIDLPLSVLEAMACNLPVITTRFGALPRLFQEGDGFHYASNEKEILSLIENYSFNDSPNTRKKVLPFDWENIVDSMETHYKRLLN